MPHWELIIFFFTIAFVYASVGFGGGSSYLAILALYALPFGEIRLIALICNIIVVTGGTIIFIRNGQVNWKKIVPLVLASVPMAFLGASLKLKQDTFFIILGTSLIVAALLLWFRIKTAEELPPESIRSRGFLKDGLTGGAIGFLSGMVGIGGGIFLAPLLHLTKWDTPKKIAAAASLFILANSVSGIAGQLSQLTAKPNLAMIAYLALAVFAGGQSGSRMGATTFNQVAVRRVTAVLVFAAGVEVLLKHLFRS